MTNNMKITLLHLYVFGTGIDQHWSRVAQRRTLIDVAAEWEQENCDPSFLVEICGNLKQSVTVLPERKEHGRFTY